MNFRVPYYTPPAGLSQHLIAWEPGHLGARGYTDVLPFVPRITSPTCGFINGLAWTPGQGVVRERPVPIDANQNYAGPGDLTVIRGLMKRPGA